MTQDLIDRLSKNIADTKSAYEAAAWADALHHVLIAIGIQKNLDARSTNS